MFHSDFSFEFREEEVESSVLRIWGVCCRNVKFLKFTSGKSRQLPKMRKQNTKFTEVILL